MPICELASLRKFASEWAANCYPTDATEWAAVIALAVTAGSMAHESFVDSALRRAPFQVKREPCVPIDILVVDRTEQIAKLSADFIDNTALPGEPLIHSLSVHDVHWRANALREIGVPKSDGERLQT
jgi:hypothetical protein